MQCNNDFSGQYFKKNRLHLEVILSSWTGVGLGLMSVLQFWCLTSGGWTLGLQLMAGSLGGLCVLASLLLRPASVYHPQRHAILHMRQYMRQVLGKTRARSRSSTDLRSKLRHRSVRAVLAAASLSSVGLLCPLVTGASLGRETGMTETQLVMLQVSLGLGQTVGSYLAGRLCLLRRSRAAPISVIILSGLGLLLCHALTSVPVSLVLSSVLAGCVGVSLRILLYRHARYDTDLTDLSSILHGQVSVCQHGLPPALRAVSAHPGLHYPIGRHQAQPRPPRLWPRLSAGGLGSGHTNSAGSKQEKSQEMLINSQSSELITF